MSTVPRFSALIPSEPRGRRAEWDEGVSFEPIRCPLHPGHQRPGTRSPELRIVLPTGPIRDFVWTGLGECLMQDEVLQLFRQEGITGFDVKPVHARIKGKSGATPPKLWEVVVTGWGGVAPPSSGVRLNAAKSCSACGLLVYSTFDDPSELIEASQWDGSDVFMVWPLPRYAFVTSRVSDLIRYHGLTGVDLEPVSDLRASGETLTPGRLSRWMPEHRAREIGLPLGIE